MVSGGTVRPSRRRRNVAFRGWPEIETQFASRRSAEWLAEAWLDSPRRDRGYKQATQRGQFVNEAARAWGNQVMTQNEGQAGGLNGLRVMVIDDSKTIRRTAETLLKREGCEVVTATDGFEALAKIADQQPQIIFVDIMMPRLDGYQTCALIKNNQVFKSTPVIMLSSKDSLFDKARGRIVGSEQYLTKPFTREELLDAIRAHVST
jgi:twitching motility two-component system response regulator PilG